jgi:hypothetical protein
MPTNKERKKMQKVLRKIRGETVNHPTHYQSSGGIESIDVIESFGLSFHLGNAVKYILRAGQKSEDPTEDLKKATWYLARHLQHTRNLALTVNEDGTVTARFPTP